MSTPSKTKGNGFASLTLGTLMFGVGAVGYGSNAWGDVYIVGQGWGSIFRVAPQ